MATSKVKKKKSKKKSAEDVSSPEVTNLTIVGLAKEIEFLKTKQKEICEQAVRSILHALDCKDHYTFGHSMRVTYYATMLGREIGLSDEELYDLEVAGLFHDIGKIGVPDSVLLKPSRLDDKEFMIMKAHPERSAEILEGFKPFEKAAKYAKHHHERYDGRGYPDSLKGDDIPLYSRIILIADTFDAMTSTRPYRKGLPWQVAYDELGEFAGSQFDPELVKHFVNVMKKEQKAGVATFTLSIIDGEFEKDAA